MWRALVSGALSVPVIAIAVGACVGEGPANVSPGADGGGGTDSGGNPPPQPPPPPPPPGDGGGDGSGDAGDGGTWTPAALDSAGSLALWLEASAANLTLSSMKVGVWKDLTKNHNDASNATSGPSVDTAAVSGHDAVHFTEYGVGLAIADAASLQFGSEQAYFAVVERAATAPTGGMFFFSKVTTGPSGGGVIFKSGFEFLTGHGSPGGTPSSVPYAHEDNGLGGAYAVAWAAAVDETTFHLVTLRRTAGHGLELAVDDAPAQTMTSGGIDISQAGNPVIVGSRVYGNIVPAVDFELAELVVVHPSNGIVDDGDVARLRAYLKSKYGL
jgi:hypothetical protein